MPQLHDPLQNHLLAALPANEYARLGPHRERVPLPLGHVLYESGRELNHVYFPTDSIVSLLYVMLDGASAEVLRLFMAAPSTLLLHFLPTPSPCRE